MIEIRKKWAKLTVLLCQVNVIPTPNNQIEGLKLKYGTMDLISQVLFLKRLCGLFKKSGPGINLSPVSSSRWV